MFIQDESNEGNSKLLVWILGMTLGFSWLLYSVSSLCFGENYCLSTEGYHAYLSGNNTYLGYVVANICFLVGIKLVFGLILWYFQAKRRSNEKSEYYGKQVLLV